MMRYYKDYLISALIFLGTFASIAISGAEVQAQSSSCPSRPGRGYRCYHDLVLFKRVGYPNADYDEEEFSPPPGYRIMNYQEVVQSRFGETSSIKINKVTGNTVANIQSAIDSSRRQLTDAKNRAESYARFPIAGTPINVGGESENIEKALRENEARLNVLSQANSNVDRIIARVDVASRCTKWAPIVNTCIDNEGGKFEGYLRIFLEYVGSPDEILSESQALTNRINEVEKTIGWPFELTNSCSRPIRFGLSYLSPTGEWKDVFGWELSPGKAITLSNNDMVIYSRNRTFYYYAETTDGSNMIWSGNDLTREFGGRSVGLKKVELSVFGNKFPFNLTCS